MKHSRDLVTTLSHSDTSHIIVGDSTQLPVLISCSVSLDGSCLQDVHLVPNISTHLILVYQIFHSGSSKIVEFSPHDVASEHLHDHVLVVSKGCFDSDIFLYMFDGFKSFNSIGISLLSHADIVRNI